ncbi:hypothetical protein HA402_009502 [Bradysia odoriphaga]|nr:hypothetical protein HA402_009502 [Bradysia odoriphaga]
MLVMMTTSDTSKRNVDQNDYVMKNSPNPEGTEWLSNWSQDMRTKSKKATPKPAEMVDTSHKLHTGPFISESALRQLQQLYGKAQVQNGAQSTFPDSIGTLPAVAMDDVIKSLTNSRRNVLPNTVREPEPQSAADKSKITADLMDVDFD